MKTVLWLIVIPALFAALPAAGAGDLVLVDRSNDANAVVVLPGDAYPIARYAAEELVLHVKKATGVELEIISESELAGEENKVKIYVGETEKGREVIPIDELESETTVLKTAGDALYIAGPDADGDPLDFNHSHSGTLWGVYEFLETELGVRWLWPGKLGTYVPRTDIIAVGEMDKTVSPHFARRHIRPARSRPDAPDERLTFTEREFDDYVRAERVFLRRHRMGRSEGRFEPDNRRGPYGHAFGGWWDRYGEENPEWFQLVGGERGHIPGDRGLSMCVSNPDLHEKVVELWLERRESAPEIMSINVCEHDAYGMCFCDDCIEWDGEQLDPENIPEGAVRAAYTRNVHGYMSRNVSDRYARFAEAVRRMAAEHEPEVKVYSYAYFNYFLAPSPDVELHPNIKIGFVPPRYFPRSEEADGWVRRQWTGWYESGVSLFYRPNWPHVQYTMPLIFNRQYADKFRFMAEHGMIGTDFDKLRGQWAAQGTVLYLLARLHTRPFAPVEDLLQEYYSAFGPAASHVKDYFEYWEEYSMSPDREGFPLEIFDPAAGILDEALETAAEARNSEYAQRVRFLQKGLEHARLCSELSTVYRDDEFYRQALEAAGPGECPRQKVVDRLAGFRDQLKREGMYVSNLAAAVRRERSLFRRTGIEGLAEPPPGIRPISTEQPAEPFDPMWVRFNSTHVIYADRDERVALRVEAAGHRNFVTFRVFSPAGRLLKDGMIDPRESVELEFTAPESGAYLVRVFPGVNWVKIHTPNRCSVLLHDQDGNIGRELVLRHPRGRVYFYVPRGLDEFMIRMAPQRHASVKATVRDAEDNVVEARDNIYPAHLFYLSRERADRGEIWSIEFEEAGEAGPLWNVELTFQAALPPFIAFEPDALLVDD